MTETTESEEVLKILLQVSEAIKFKTLKKDIPLISEMQLFRSFLHLCPKNITNNHEWKKNHAKVFTCKASLPYNNIVYTSTCSNCKFHEGHTCTSHGFKDMCVNKISCHLLFCKVVGYLYLLKIWIKKSDDKNIQP
jgi:hypothetical protein